MIIYIYITILYLLLGTVYICIKKRWKTLYYNQTLVFCLWPIFFIIDSLMTCYRICDIIFSFIIHLGLKFAMYLIKKYHII